MSQQFKNRGTATEPTMFIGRALLWEGLAAENALRARVQGTVQYVGLASCATTFPTYICLLPLECPAERLSTMADRDAIDARFRPSPRVSSRDAERLWYGLIGVRSPNQLYLARVFTRLLRYRRWWPRPKMHPAHPRCRRCSLRR